MSFEQAPAFFNGNATRGETVVSAPRSGRRESSLWAEELSICARL